MLAGVLLAGLILRLPLLTVASSSYRLTEAFSIDEVENVRISTGMLHKHTLNPHAFEYPSLFYYLSLVPERILDATGHRRWTDDLIGVRVLSLLFGLALVVATGLLARRLAGDSAGVLAAALVAFDRTLIESSAIAKPNAAQVFFVMAAFVLIAAVATRPRVATASLAAALLALATATKWLGALGLAPLALAPLLASPPTDPPGWRRLTASARAGLERPVKAWCIIVPLAVFGVISLACVPFALLSVREFGFGLAQTFTAQSLHRRDLPFWISFSFLLRSMGPLGMVAAMTGTIWAALRTLRWEGSAHDRGLALVLGWVLAYGALLLFVFVRLSSYLDLWNPFLAVLAACAWVGEQGILGSSRARTLALAAVLGAGILSNGAYAASRARVARTFDTRAAAGAWMETAAADSDSVLADLGLYVPDRIGRVIWNGWGSPPRVIYDETVTWGQDTAWPDWNGGHRRLLFENAKWAPALERLAARPRWVATSDEWRAIRAHPAIASESAAPDYDLSLADGRAGYVLRARFSPSAPPAGDWALRRAIRSASSGPPWYDGPTILIYERVK